MKGNDGTGHTKERDVWETPQKLWDQLNEQYDFDFDCCADINNTKCELFSDNFEHYIPNDNMVSWMNPPFSNAFAMFENFFIVVKKGVAIYRCDNMETKLWQDIIFKNATWILIPKGRWSYEGFEGIGSRFASALIGFNVEVPKFLTEKYTILKIV